MPIHFSGSSNPMELPLQTLKTRGRLAAALVLGTLCVACGSEPTAPRRTAPATVIITPEISTLTAVAEEATLGVVVRDSSGTALPDAPVSWTSTVPAVAAVADGVVTAVANGSTMIVANAGTAADTAQVTVSQRPAAIVLDRALDTLRALSATLSLAASVADAGGTPVAGVPVTWRSTDEAVASVDGAGTVTAVSNGVTFVIASAAGLADSSRIVVWQRPGTIAVSPDTDTLVSINQQLVLTAVVTDIGGTAIDAPVIAWSATDGNVATVDATGTVTARMNGTTALIALADGVADTVTVVVRQVVAALGASGVSAADTLRALNATLQLTGQPVDANGYPVPGRTVSWSSSDPLIADVDGTGLLIARGEGSVTVTAAVDTCSAQLDVTVYQLVDTVVISVEAGPLVEGDTLHVEAGARDPGGSAIARVTPVLSVTDTAIMVLETPTRLRGRGPGAATVSASADGKTTTVALAVVLRFAAVTAGGFHACGLATSGNAYCWGVGGNGQLGTGLTTDALLPVRVVGGKQWTQLTAGFRFTCGIARDGLSYCWGLNDEGQFGDGTTVSSSSPTLAGGGVAYSDIESGQQHVCGRASTGAFCWGANSGRQLGDSMTIMGVGYSTVPSRVRGGVDLTALTGGGDYTCGVNGTGSAYCWGSNRGYKLGVDTGWFVSYPAAVSGGVAFASVEAGSGATCALTPAGELYCWGADDNYGGLGTTQTAQTCATGLPEAPLAPCTSTPLPILQGTTIVEVSGGIGGTCAVSTAGVAYCWGMDINGSLGAPPPETCYNPSAIGCARTPVQVSGDLQFSSIAVGFGAVCALAPDGRVYCWGTGGRLGNGDSQHRSEPALIARQ